MYEWNTTTFGPGTFDGQLQVDSQRYVWEWIAARSAWERRPQYELRKTEEFFVPAWGDVGNPLARNASLPDTWDTFFRRAFVRLTLSDSGDTFHVADIAYSDLAIWVESHLPTSGGQYVTNFLLEVFEVVNRDAAPKNLVGFNQLYSGLRGRGAYRGRGKRSDAGLDRRAGVPNTFRSIVTPSFDDLMDRIVQHFFGVSPAADPDSHKALWFSARKTDAHNQPKVPLHLNQGWMNNPKDAGFVAYNSTTNTFVDVTSANNGFNPVTDAGGNSSPAVLSMEAYQPAMGSWNRDISVSTPSDSDGIKAWRGFITDRSKVLCYLCRCSTDPDLWCFYLKPLNVTHLACYTDLDPTVYELVSEASGRGDPKRVLRHIVTPVEDRRVQANGWRWRMYDSITPRITTSAFYPGQRGVDTTWAPTEYRFYLRNPATGLRTEYIADSISIQRRTNNASVKPVIRRAWRP